MRFFLFLLASLALTTAAGAQVRAPVHVNTTGSNPLSDKKDGHNLVNHGSQWVACWAEMFGTDDTHQDIYCSTSMDDGTTWTTPTRVDTGDLPNEWDSDEPKCVVTDDGTIIVVFQELRLSLNAPERHDVFFNRSTDGGLTWMPAAMPLNTGTAGLTILSDVDRIWIDSDGNTAVVIWEEDTLTPGGGVPEELWFTKSTDAGANWSTPVIIVPSPLPPPPTWGDVDSPKISISGQDIIVSYIDDGGPSGTDDVRAVTSNDGGATWTFQLLESNTDGEVENTSIARDGDLVCVAWFDNEVDPIGAHFGVHAAISQDGGATWLPEVSLSPATDAVPGSRVQRFALELRGAHAYVAYTSDYLDVSTGGAGGQDASKAYFAVSYSGGTNWVVDIPIDAGDPRANNRPWLVATEDQVFVHLELGPVDSHTLGYAVSNDFGQTWLPIEQVAGAGPDIDSEDQNNGPTIGVNEVTGVALSIFWDNNATGTNEVYVAGISSPLVGIGTNYCGPAVANSTGMPGIISAAGSDRAGGFLELTAQQLPQGRFGIFIVGQTQGFFVPPGSVGNICLQGNIGKFNTLDQIGFTGTLGAFVLEVDTTSIPVNPPVAVLAGETWNFQAWFRDAGNTNNFTDALSVVFQ